MRAFSWLGLACWPRHPSGASTERTIDFKYIWDPSVEVGYSWVETETAHGFVSLTYPRLVARSGEKEMDRWHHKVRDLSAEYRRFSPGKPAPPVVRLAIQCQSEHADGAGASCSASIANLNLVAE